MAVYRVGDAVGSTGGVVGPFSHDGVLYCVAVTYRSESHSERTVYGVYSSADGGATWSQTGSTFQVPSTDDTGDWHVGGNYELDGISGCLDYQYPTSPYAYVCHAAPDLCLRVRRLNLTTGTFDLESDAGPNVFPSTSSLAGSVFYHWLIEQSTEGTFGVLANLFPSAAGMDRVFALTLGADLTGWSSRTAMTVPYEDSQYVGAGVSRGTDGRIHGFVARLAPGETSGTMYHALVVGSGGSIGSTFASVASGDEIFRSFACGAHDGAGRVGFAFAHRDVGLGLIYRFAVAYATSADNPTFTIHDFDVSIFGNSMYGALAGGGTNFTAVWSRDDADTGIHFSSFNGSMWSDSATPETGLTPFSISARNTEYGCGALFLQWDGNANAVWYLSFGAAGITGLNGIESGEEFGKTHGISGGGDPVRCGTLNVEQPTNACNPVPSPTTPTPTERNACPTIGYAY
jgi:hypothetical protein